MIIRVQSYLITQLLVVDQRWYDCQYISEFKTEFSRAHKVPWSFDKSVYPFVFRTFSELFLKPALNYAV